MIEGLFDRRTLEVSRADKDPNADLSEAVLSGIVRCCPVLFCAAW